LGAGVSGIIGDGAGTGMGTSGIGLLAGGRKREYAPAIISTITSATIGILNLLLINFHLKISMEQSIYHYTSLLKLNTKPTIRTCKKNAMRPLKHRDENIEPQRRKRHKGYAKNILADIIIKTSAFSGG